MWRRDHASQSSHHQLSQLVSVLPFYIDVHHVVVRVEVFYEHGIKSHLVLHVGKNDLRGCSIYIVGDIM